MGEDWSPFAILTSLLELWGISEVGVYRGFLPDHNLSFTLFLAQCLPRGDKLATVRRAQQATEFWDFSKCGPFSLKGSCLGKSECFSYRYHDVSIFFRPAVGTKANRLSEHVGCCSGHSALCASKISTLMLQVF